jgi:hypothetical protein
VKYLPTQLRYSVTYVDGSGEKCALRKDLKLLDHDHTGVHLNPAQFKEALEGVRAEAIQVFSELDKSRCDRMREARGAWCLLPLIHGSHTCAAKFVGL